MGENTRQRNRGPSAGWPRGPCSRVAHPSSVRAGRVPDPGRPPASIPMAARTAASTSRARPRARAAPAARIASSSPRSSISSR